MSLQFNYCQSFKINPDSVGGSPYVNTTGVDLYFKKRPDRNRNKSGIKDPSINVFLTEFKNDLPDLDKIINTSRVSLPYDSINILSDASVATTFRFPSPVTLATDKTYGIGVLFDDDCYDVWIASQNQRILGSTKTYSGTSGDGDGKLFYFTSDYYTTGKEIRPLSDRDLKFQLYIAKYNQINDTVTAVNDSYEFFTITNASSNRKYPGGESVYQPFGNSSSNTTYSKTGTIATEKNSKTITGTGTKFDTDYSVGDKLITTESSGNTFIAEITAITSNTIMTVDEFVPFTNTGLNHISSPVGEVFHRDYVLNRIYLKDSTSTNSTFKFVTNGIYYFTISNGGSGYSNTDTILASNGVVNCAANLTTNSTGGITTVNIINPGEGFPANGDVQIDITTSGGSSASLAAVLGAPLIGETSNATSTISSVDNFEVDIIDPGIEITSGSASQANAQISLANTTYFKPAGYTSVDVEEETSMLGKRGQISSRSNEVTNDSNLHANAKSLSYKIEFISNNPDDANNSPLYSSPNINQEDLDMFVIRNKIDTTSANTDSEIGQGIAQSKYVSLPTSLGENRLAEDVRVYLNAYRPLGTAVKVYIKMHNSGDKESWDDKSWSPMELDIENNSLQFYSATGNKFDTQEFEYRLPRYPEVDFTCNGTVTVSTGDANVVTSVDLQTELSNNDVVRIYNPLFANTNYMVAVVNTVINSTAFSIDESTANSDLLGSGLKVDKLKFKNVAFNNIQGDNVARYYTSNYAKYDGYNSYALKVVLQADDSSNPPEVLDIRAVAVSA
jgi:hypothetical protein